LCVVEIDVVEVDDCTSVDADEVVGGEDAFEAAEVY